MSVAFRGIFLLLSGDNSFLKVSVPAMSPGWATWLEPFYQPGPRHMVPVQLCRAVVPTWRYMIPQVPFHTHKQDIPILSLLWLGAEPPPGKHMVGCIHSGPLLGISHKPRFWTSWLDGAMALKMANLWSLITVTFLFTDINSFHTHLTHSTNYEPSCC